MPSNAIAKTSESPASKPLEVIIREWLVKFCAAFDKQLTQLLVATWCEALMDLDPKKVDAACLKVMRTAEFFPNPGVVRKHIDTAQSKGLELEAEQAWQRVFKFAVNPHFSGISELDQISDHAARAAGGLSWIESCPEDQVPWVKKKFIEAYLRIHELCQVEHLLTDGEAKKLLQMIASHSHCELPAACSTTTEVPTIEGSEKANV